MRNTYLVRYDVHDEKRLRKVFKAMRDLGDHLQCSVFERQFTPIDLARRKTRGAATRSSPDPGVSRSIIGEAPDYLPARMVNEHVYRPRLLRMGGGRLRAQP